MPLNSPDAPRKTDATLREKRWRALLEAGDPLALFAAQEVTADPWQERFLRSQAPRVLLNCSRQSGKSTSTAVLALHTALTTAESLVLLLSPSLRQSSELFRKCAQIYQAVGKPVSATSETSLALTLKNGSRLVSLPGKEATVRGFSGVRLLVVDEASRVPDALYRAVRPMLAVSGGRLVALSTPFGKRGWFYEEWEHGGDAWERYRVPATECPRISREFLAEEERALGAVWFASEYLCAFADSVAGVFRAEDIDRALSSDVQPLFGPNDAWHEHEHEHEQAEDVAHG